MFQKNIFLLFLLIIFQGCSLFTNPDKDDNDNQDVIISENFVELNEETLNNIISFDENGKIVFPKNSKTKKLKTGNIINSGPAEIVPYGYLKKIQSVKENGDQVELTTVNATFEEVFEKVDVSIEEKLSLSELLNHDELGKGIILNKSLSENGEIHLDINTILEDADGNYETTSDQTKLEGFIKIEVDFSFNFGIDWFELSYLYFDNWIIDEVDLKLITSKELLKLNPEQTLITLNFGVITIPVPPVVITIHPKMPIKLGAILDVGIKSETRITQDATIQSGFKYNKSDGWELIDNKEFDFGFDLPKHSAEAMVKGYISPRIELLFYDVAGPWAGVQGYLELDTKFARTPWWILYSGIKVEAGVIITIFSHDLLDNGWTIMDFKNELAHAEPKFGAISGLVLDVANERAIANLDVTILQNGEIISQDITNENGGFYFELESGVYDLETSHNGYLSENYKDIEIPIDRDIHLDTIFQISESFSGTGNIGGMVVDSLSGINLSNVELKLRKGINNKTGEIVKTITSNDNGFYTFQNIKAGNYTLEAIKNNYIVKYLTVLSLGGKSMDEQNLLLVPDINQNQ